MCCWVVAGMWCHGPSLWIPPWPCLQVGHACFQPSWGWEWAAPLQEWVVGQRMQGVEQNKRINHTHIYICIYNILRALHSGEFFEVHFSNVIKNHQIVLFIVCEANNMQTTLIMIVDISFGSHTNKNIKHLWLASPKSLYFIHYLCMMYGVQKHHKMWCHMYIYM